MQTGVEFFFFFSFPSYWVTCSRTTRACPSVLIELKNGKKGSSGIHAGKGMTSDLFQSCLYIDNG